MILPATPHVRVFFLINSNGYGKMELKTVNFQGVPTLPDQPGTIGSRIRLVRGKISPDEFSTRLCVHKNTLGNYERDERQPSSEFLTNLHVQFKTDITWLLTGIKPTQEAAPMPSPSPALDEELMRQIGDGISRVYKEESVGIGAGQLTSRALRIYSDLVDFSAEERPIALKGILAQLRRDLCQPASTMTEDKRLA